MLVSTAQLAQVTLFVVTICRASLIVGPDVRLA
jgi:hypothetical protein